MPLITVNKGGPEIAPGVYPVALVKLEGPKRVTAQRGPNAGQEIDLFDWTFSILGGDYDGQEIEATTSTASGPKSKMFGFLTALLGGRPPAVGSSFEATDLISKIALATVSVTEGGWPRVDNLGAMPAQMLAQHTAGTPVTAPVGVAPAPAPAAAAAPTQTADVPF